MQRSVAVIAWLTIRARLSGHEGMLSTFEARWNRVAWLTVSLRLFFMYFFFFFQAEDGIRDLTVTGVQTCALPICSVAGGGMARLRAGSESARMKRSKPAGSVTSRKRAWDDVTVKVWGMPRGP